MVSRDGRLLAPSTPSGWTSMTSLCGQRSECRTACDLRGCDEADPIVGRLLTRESGPSAPCERLTLDFYALRIATGSPESQIYHGVYSNQAMENKHRQHPGSAVPLRSLDFESSKLKSENLECSPLVAPLDARECVTPSLLLAVVSFKYWTTPLFCEGGHHNYFLIDLAVEVVEPGK